MWTKVKRNTTANKQNKQAHTKTVTDVVHRGEATAEE